MFGIEAVTAELRRIRQELAWGNQYLQSVADAAWKSLGPPSPIRGFSISREGEHGMGMVFSFALPTELPDSPQSADVVGGRVRFTVNGTEHSFATEKGQASLGNIDIKQDALVGPQEFVFVDDAGNVSANPLVLPEFTVVDNIAPSDPVEGFAVASVGEVADSESTLG